MFTRRLASEFIIQSVTSGTGVADIDASRILIRNEDLQYQEDPWLARCVRLFLTTGVTLPVSLSCHGGRRIRRTVFDSSQEIRAPFPPSPNSDR